MNSIPTTAAIATATPLPTFMLDPAPNWEYGVIVGEDVEPEFPVDIPVDRTIELAETRDAEGWNPAEAEAEAE